MTTYPGGIYTPRTKENKNGVVYDPAKKTVGYAEDLTKLDDEVVAIETELGANASGVYATVKAWLTALTGAIVTVFTGLTDTPANYTGQGGKAVKVKTEENGLEFGDVEPMAHDLGGAKHNADTLANLNSKVSDATLDDIGDSRTPTTHSLGGAKHNADTLANLNSKVSDATLDDIGDSRTPTAHKSSHQNGGGDEIGVAGLSGKLADPQTPDAHKSSHASGGDDELTDKDQQDKAGIVFIIDGGGSAIKTGIKGAVTLPFKCEIISAEIVTDQNGSIVVDIWKDTYANYPPTDADSITASAPLTISSSNKAQDITLTNWTKTLLRYDTLIFNVDSVATVEWASITLRIKRVN